MSNTYSRLWAPIALCATGALALSACVSTNSSTGVSDSNGDSAKAITVGTTDKITSLDPAGAYDNGSFAVAINVYPYLLGIKPGGNELEPDVAESYEFSDANTLRVKLKSGLKYPNGHDLTASDVKFSFDRMTAINDPDGPSSLLANLKETVVVDDTTVDFKLAIPNDQTFPQILTTPAAPILDEEVFSPTELTDDQDIVKGKGFGGPYVLTSYKVNELLTYQAYADYQGLHKPQNTDVKVQYLADETNMKQKLENGEIDLAFHSLSPTAVAALSQNSKLTVHEGPGGELRYLVFNTDTMPYGKKTANADDAKALAVRQAMASVIDRAAISKTIFKGNYTPAYSMVPDSMPGAATPFKQYGDGNGGPSVEKATALLKDAGVETPVALQIQYSPDHYGNSSADEYSMIKEQLESSHLFTVELQSTAWTTYNKERISSYPIYQLGWFPDFSDADNYLSPFFLPTNFVQSWNSGLPEALSAAVAAQTAQSDHEKRMALLATAQEEVAKTVLALPMQSGKQIAVSQKDLQGVVLDASFKLYYSTLNK